ncbi:hypothetical protein [Streptomyces brasiliscabiei]|uniref:hypothetical protein n=1 Tax=Streptomyces brasiliscabiei TaxID=2736302 RepID=UPI001C0F94BB|nr:hypothetical protein [Streptomyces brasiliscabiei]
MSKFVYRNKNTGDVVEYDCQSPRLEMLPNWVTLQDPEAEVEPEPPHAPPAHEKPLVVEPVKPVEPKQESPVVIEPVDLTTPDEPDAAGDGSGPDAAPERPARAASKADWQEYARARAQDSVEEAAVGGLTKDELIKQYGGDN